MPDKKTARFLFAVIFAGAMIFAGISLSHAQIQDPLGLGSLGVNKGAGEEPEEGNAAVTSEIDPAQDEFLKLSVQEQVIRNSKIRTPKIKPNEVGSIFFTQWQYSLLQEMKKQGKENPLPGPGEESVVQPGIRELSLGGIAFADADDWTIWLNGQRVTPEAIPEHVIDLRVSSGYIELKWFDPYTNLIFPVRLRPHQRFNLDARIFLPGEGRL